MDFMSREYCRSWLDDENFDFNIESPSSISHDSGDEEVFIGPLTHKEKCIAFAVSEREAQNACNFDEVNPEQQAMLLRESALVALKIKQKDLSINTTPRRRTSVGADSRIKSVNDCDNTKNESKEEVLRKG